MIVGRRRREIAEAPPVILRPETSVGISNLPEVGIAGYKLLFLTVTGGTVRVTSPATVLAPTPAASELLISKNETLN